MQIVCVFVCMLNFACKFRFSQRIRIQFQNSRTVWWWKSGAAERIQQCHFYSTIFISESCIACSILLFDFIICTVNVSVFLCVFLSFSRSVSLSLRYNIQWQFSLWGLWLSVFRYSLLVICIYGISYSLPSFHRFIRFF